MGLGYDIQQDQLPLEGDGGRVCERERERERESQDGREREILGGILSHVYVAEYLPTC